MSRAMFDSVTAARLPSNATLVGAYADGHYQNVDAVRRQCPHATVVTITVKGNPGANVADVETGDLTPEQGAQWAANEVKAGRLPTLYMNLSTWPEVQRHVAAHGIAGKVSYWVAHYDGKADIPAGAVAKQYQERKDQNLDYSLAVDHWPGVDHSSTAPAHAGPAPRPHNPHPRPTSTLKQGSTGPGVQWVQWELSIPDDGNYGPQTAGAVQSFQHTHGLGVDGVAGPETINALAQHGR